MARLADPKSNQVRISPDLAAKLRAIGLVDRETMAEFLDPLIRPAVERKYARLLPDIRREARRRVNSLAGK